MPEIADSFIEKIPKVLEEGRFAETASNAVLTALQLFDNGAFFDVDIQPAPSIVRFNPEGRHAHLSNATVLGTEMTLDVDGNVKTVVAEVSFTPPECITAHIVDPENDQSKADLRVMLHPEDEEPTVLNIIAINELDVDESLLFVIQGVLAAGYMAGRRDQISDMFNSNQTRFVKARDLATVVKLASSATETEYGFFSDFSADPKRTVEALKSLRGSLKGLPIESPDLALYTFPQPRFDKNTGEIIFEEDENRTRSED